MGIEQQMSFDFNRTEKIELLREYGFTVSEDNLKKLEKVEGTWLYDGESIEKYTDSITDLYSGNDNSEPYNKN